MIDEPPNQTAGDRARRHRGDKHWRREQPHRKPDASPPLRAPAAEMVTRLAHRNVAVAVVRDQDHPFDLHLRFLDLRDESVVAVPMSRYPATRTSVFACGIVAIPSARLKAHVPGPRTGPRAHSSKISSRS
jgi:hypothetical protein